MIECSTTLCPSSPGGKIKKENSPRRISKTFFCGAVVPTAISYYLYGLWSNYIVLLKVTKNGKTENTVKTNIVTIEMLQSVEKLIL